jgi:hypothetical protein
MTSESQRLALLEWAGWKRGSWTVVTLCTGESMVDDNGWTDPATGETGPCPPDLSSLDCLAEFEAKLDEETLLNFFRCLNTVVDREHGGKVVAFAVGRAKPSHRLEALVRALGLWREGE